MDRVFFIVSGPSGSGKTTLTEQVELISSLVKKVVSDTTRPKDADEIDGKHYHFISEDEFLRRMDDKDNQYVEWAWIHNNYYGTREAAIKEVLALNKNPIFVVDPRGMRAICEWAEDKPVVRIFIRTKDPEELIQRRKKRNDLKIRHKESLTWLEQENNYDVTIWNHKDQSETSINILAGIVNFFSQLHL